MPQMNMVQAIGDALRLAMRKDPRVILLGEDVGRTGGVFRVTSGLIDEFGEERVVDAPLSENGIIGTRARYGALRHGSRAGDPIWGFRFSRVRSNRKRAY